MLKGGFHPEQIGMVTGLQAPAFPNRPTRGQGALKEPQGRQAATNTLGTCEQISGRETLLMQ